MNICIIGAGWFGCFIGHELLKKKYIVDIYEKEKDIFLNASGNNQNRLHLGFHYPRSSITRKLSKTGFEFFKKKFSTFSKKINNNFYAVSNTSSSKINFNKYLSIMSSSKLQFKKIHLKNFPYLKNLEGVIKSNEELILIEKVKKYYKKKLKKNIVFKYYIETLKKKKKKYIINKKKYDFVINCTSLHFSKNKIKKLTYEYCTILLYKSLQKNHPAITIMDGPFFTLYPWDNKKNFGLYSVVRSRLLIDKNLNSLKCKVRNFINKKFIHDIKKKIEYEYSHFYPSFKKKFRFVKFLNSYRTIIDNKFDSRNCKVESNNNFINVFPGKIDHVFYALEQVEKCLKKF